VKDVFPFDAHQNDVTTPPVGFAPTVALTVALTVAAILDHDGSGCAVL